jgi:hypothetical protein
MVERSEKVSEMRAAPNKSLHRTSAALPPSPVSSKPLGDGKKQSGNVTFRAAARVGALATVLVLGVSQRARACSCLECLTDPVVGLKKSGLVFSGEVISVEVVRLPRVVYTKGENNKLVPSQYMERVGVVTLRVLKEWKGDGASEYVVLAGAPPVTPLPQGTWLADCAVHLEVGRQYLIFATEGFAEANSCAPTGDLEKRQQDVAALEAHSGGRRAPKASQRSR